MKIDNAAIEQLFLNARTANGFLDKPVPASLLQDIYDIAKMGAIAAAEIISHFGARSSADLKALIAQKLG